MASPLHLGNGHAIDSGECRVGPSLDTHHLGDGQTRGVQPVHSARGEQITLLNVGARRHETQFHTTAMARHRIAIRDTADTGAKVQHRDGLIAVNQQGDLTHERVHACDLAQHTLFVEHWRAQFDPCHLALVHHHTTRIGIGGVIQHLRCLGGCFQPGPQVEQLTQARIFLHQLLGLHGALRHQRHLLAGRIGVILGRLQGLKVTAALGNELDRLQHHPLHRVKHSGHHLAQRARDLKTRVRHHQKQRQRAVEKQP